MTEQAAEKKTLSISVSKAKVFDSCKKQFKFQYIEKLPRKEWDHHTYGKFVHRILELFHKKYIDGSTDPYIDVMHCSFDEAYIEFKDKLSEEQRLEGKQASDAYLTKYSQQMLKNKFDVLAVEKEFRINVNDNLLLVGFIDRVQKDNDGIMHVCDYKTTKNKKYLKNDWFQLLTYAYTLLLEDPTIEIVRGSYILVRHKFEYITETFDRRQILSVKNKFEKYAEDISEEKLYRANPSALCKYCDALEFCVEGKATVMPNLHYGQTTWGKGKI